MSTTESMISAAHLSPIETLGIRLEDAFTAEQAMEGGNLGNWNVRKSPMSTVVDGKRLTVPGMNVVVRDNPLKPGQVDVLSRHGVADGFHIVQNEEHAGFLNALVDESGANFELAGAIDSGRKVFLSMRLPGHIMVGGVDRVDVSLLALNAHDGSMSFTLVAAPVRYACANVENIPFQGHSGIIRVRHTSGAQKNLVAKAREALDIQFKYLDAFQEEAERMINTTMTQSQFEQIIEREFGAPDDAAKAAVTRADKKIEQMAELFADTFTQENIRGTAWAGFNALTEWSDHFSPTRGAEDERSFNRAQKAILDPSFKETALRLMTV